MDTKFKKYTLGVLAGALLIQIVYVGSLLIVDPLRIFHKPWVRDNYFVDEMRFQAAGIINNVEFDSIILGTSMAQNFSPKEASDVWGADFVNISLSGGKLSERDIILNYAFGKKDLKNIIITIDDFSELGVAQEDFSQYDFDYLYNNSRLDDLKVYLSTKYGQCLFCQNHLFPFLKQECEDTKPLETITEWASQETHSRRFGGLNKWFEAGNHYQIIEAFEEIVKSTNCIKQECDSYDDKDEIPLEDAKTSFDEYVLTWIEKYPETEFYLFFPPYSRLKYAIWIQEGQQRYTDYIEKIRYIVRKSESYPNAHVFGFDHLDFLDDIANYKDTGHYHQRFNSMMLTWMKNGEYELTNENVEPYIEEITKRALDYDVVSIGEKIEEYLKSQNVLITEH